LIDGDDDSDEEFYSKNVARAQVFPWQQKGYKNLFDAVSLKQTEDYPKASQSDRVIEMKEKIVLEVKPPARILIVSPTSNGCDRILDLLIPYSKTIKIIRFGQSNTRPDLNKLFTLNIPRDAENS
jgi:hypothetical protein